MKNNFENHRENIQEINCVDCGQAVEIHITPGFLGKEVMAVNKEGKDTGQMIEIAKEDPATFVCRACRMQRSGQSEKIVQQEEKRKQY